MKSSGLPFEKMVFVCTNKRANGERISCAGEGRCGEKILLSLKAAVKEKHLEKKIRVAKSGCQEKCEDGPNLVILPTNEFLSGIREEDIPAITTSLLSSLS